jgi:hypothetical protein
MWREARVVVMSAHRTWHTYLMGNATTDRLLGDQGHVRQVRYSGNARSRAAFARLLIAKGAAVGSLGSVEYQLSQYGSEGMYLPELGDGKLWVQPLNAPRDEGRVEVP